MAAPSSTDLRNLAGKYKLNKSLSADIAAILALQGTNSLLTKAISSASVSLSISQPNSNEYKIRQSATAAAIPGTTEQYILDNEWRTNSDPFFGKVKGRAKWLSLEEAQELEDVEGGWEDCDDGKVIFAEGGSEDGKWSAFRVWGFREVEGVRRWVQGVKVWNDKGEKVVGHMVYDFVE